MESVFPTVSSAAWLSSLTGMAVADHGVPGVVFRVDGAVVNLYDYTGPLMDSTPDNVFSDAVAAGHRAVAVLGDLANYPCSWRDLLLAHADVVAGELMFTRPGAYTPRPLDRLDLAVRATVAAGIDAGRCSLVWCFVEVDTHLHHFGDDEYAVAALRLIERIALELVGAGHVVAAHSDHGQTPTIHDAGLARLLDVLAAEHGFTMGGAGRTRWVYPATGTAEELAERLHHDLPADIRIEWSDALFPPGSPAHARVGELVLVAEAERFLAPPGYRFEHGSSTPAEVEVPFAVWGGADEF